MKARYNYRLYPKKHGSSVILKQLVPQLWKNACVVMDNARIHLEKMVEEAIEQAGAKLIYLSPYSPEFSPIENFWLICKSYLEKT